MHIVPNLMVPPPPQTILGAQKMDNLVCLNPTLHNLHVIETWQWQYCMQWQCVYYLSIIGLILSCGWPNIIWFGPKIKNLLNLLHEIYKYVTWRWGEGGHYKQYIFLLNFVKNVTCHRLKVEIIDMSFKWSWN